jgi:predicted anti-sigma-YlaC factor YlaD
MKNMSRKYAHFTQALLAMATPWAISIGIYALVENWMPGEVRRTTWEWMSTTIFLIFTLVVFALVFRSKLRKSAKNVIATVLALGGLYLSLSFQVHFNCEEQSQYIGARLQISVASCT